MSKKVSKRIEKLSSLFDKNNLHSIKEATTLIKKLKSTKFDESVEIAMNLNVDPRHADQMVRGSVILPNGTGKKVRIAAFVKDVKLEEAKNAGADIVGTESLIADIKNNKIEFDICIATPDCMSEIGKVAKILGPKGLMPSPKVGTVTTDISKTINNLKNGQVNFKVDKKGNIHSGIAKISFSEDKIEENLIEFIKAINKNKPSTSKGKYIKSATISLTMSPSIKLETQALLDIK